MTLNALWPFAAIAAPRLSVVAEVCSAHRTHRAAPAEAPQGHVHAAHCALCTFHGQWNTAIPATARPFFAPPRAAEAVPERDDMRPAEAALDPTALPRAPPSFS